MHRDNYPAVWVWFEICFWTMHPILTTFIYDLFVSEVFKRRFAIAGYR